MRGFFVDRGGTGAFFGNRGEHILRAIARAVRQRSEAGALQAKRGETFVVLRILLGTAIDPTSRNPWPLEVVMWGGSGYGAMLLGLARR